jgi:hypothetical protein
MYRIASLALILALLTGCSDDTEESQIFELTIQNKSAVPSFTTASGAQAPIVYSPALGVIHSGPNPMYTIGLPAPASGIEKFAEDADTSDIIPFLQADPSVELTILGLEPIEENANQGALLPGNTYRIVFNVQDKAAVLSLVLQFLPSNDIIVGSNSDGIPLFNADGTPRAGDITADFQLLDAGTEANQAPGDGADQAILQMESNQGAAEAGVVRPVDDGFSYPSVSDSLTITINPLSVVD